MQKVELNVYGKSQPVYPELERLLKDKHPGILEELAHRRQLGIEKYGMELHTFNGRKSAIDFEEEILDSIQYFTQFIMQVEAALGVQVPDKTKQQLLEKLIGIMSLTDEAMVLLRELQGLTTYW